MLRIENGYEQRRLLYTLLQNMCFMNKNMHATSPELAKF